MIFIDNILSTSPLDVGFIWARPSVYKKYDIWRRGWTEKSAQKVTGKIKILSSTSSHRTSCLITVWPKHEPMEDRRKPFKRKWNRLAPMQITQRLNGPLTQIETRFCRRMKGMPLVSALTKKAWKPFCPDPFNQCEIGQNADMVEQRSPDIPWCRMLTEIGLSRKNNIKCHLQLFKKFSNYMNQIQ